MQIMSTKSIREIENYLNATGDDANPHLLRVYLHYKDSLAALMAVEVSRESKDATTKSRILYMIAKAVYDSARQSCITAWRIFNEAI